IPGQFCPDDPRGVDANQHFSLVRLWLWHVFIEEPLWTATTMHTDGFHAALSFLSISSPVRKRVEHHHIFAREHLASSAKGEKSCPLAYSVRRHGWPDDVGRWRHGEPGNVHHQTERAPGLLAESIRQNHPREWAALAGWVG